jgi:type IV pilus assembly protein PilY1
MFQVVQVDLGTPTLVDVNFDGVIDYAYAGDFGGGLYRFNFLSPNPNNWTATKIFQTAAKQPITAAPAVFRNSADKYTVIAGTGSEIYQEDLAAKDQQSLYGIFDDLTLEGSAAQVADYDLLTQTLSVKTSRHSAGTLEIRKSSNNAIVADRHKGWKINFDGSNGERITVKPSIMGNSVLLATRIMSKKSLKTRVTIPVLTKPSAHQAAPTAG